MPVENTLAHVFRRIARFDILSCESHGEVARWLAVHPIFRDEALFKPILYAQWTRLDLEQSYPRWRFQAAIEGNVHAFQSVENAWVGLHRQFPVGALTCSDQPPIEAKNDLVYQHGETAAYNEAVLLETRDRATFNRNIKVDHPLFKSRQDEELYLDGLRQLLDFDGYVGGVTFLDILCILCRDDGPFPVYDAGDSVPSPAFELMDLFLKSAPNDKNYPFHSTPRAWKLISGTVQVHPRVFRRLWDYEKATMRNTENEDERASHMERIVDICVRSLFNESYAYHPETTQGSASGANILYQYRVIDWLCTNHELRDKAIGHIMGSGIYHKNTPICMYILRRYPDFTHQDVHMMIQLTRNRRYIDMLNILIDHPRKKTVPFPIVWSAQFGLWNWSAASQKDIFQLYGLAEEFARASISYHPNQEDSSSNSDKSSQHEGKGEKS